MTTFQDWPTREVGSWSLTTDFPSCPVAAEEPLVPIMSRLEMVRETQVTGVAFGGFWDDSVRAGTTYFFSWLQEPRSTVLTIFDGSHLTHCECRTRGDRRLAADESLPIMTEVKRLFERAGYAARLE